MNRHPDLQLVARGEREIVITRVFNAPRELVFEAYTKPELLRRWLLGPDGWTMPVCDIDLRVGGAYRFVWRNAEGREMGMGGVYREIVRPERIVWTELFDQDWTGGEAISTVTLQEHAGKTTMTNVALYVSREARDNVLKSGMERGVKVSYERLDDILVDVVAA
jgi:uncharacterized protein YndB with AHSA1/START domain